MMNRPDYDAHAQHYALERKDLRDEGWFMCLGDDAFPTLENNWADWLHSEEAIYYQSLTSENRRKSYLLGRVSAKIAYQAATKIEKASSINIRTGVFKDPVIQNQTSIQWHVGITHTNTIAGALAFPATHPMALDMEELVSTRIEVMKTQCKSEELQWLQAAGLEGNVAAAVCWTAKEAISKALRTGMTCPFELLGLQSIHAHEDGGITGLFVNFHQYQFRSWILANKVLSIVLPKRTRILFAGSEPKLPNEIA